MPQYSVTPKCNDSEVRNLIYTRNLATPDEFVNEVLDWAHAMKAICEICDGTCQLALIAKMSESELKKTLFGDT